MTAALTEAPKTRHSLIPTGALTRALSEASKLIPTRPPIPAMAGALVETGPNGTTISVFDYETSVVLTVDRTPQPATRGLVPAAQLRALLKHHDQKATSLLRVEDDGWSLSQGSLNATGELYSAGDYPKLPSARAPWVFEIGGDELHALAVRALISAIKPESTLPILECAHLSLDRHQLTVATTDRYRLGVSAVPVQRNGRVRLLKDWAHAQVVAKSLATVAALFKGQQVRVSWDHERMVLRGDSVVATLRQMDGQFPKYAALFPTEYSATASLDKGQLLGGIKYVSETLTRNEPITLRLSAAGLTLEAGETTKATVTIDVGRFTGDEVTIAFNPTYLRDATGTLGERISLLINKPTRPAVLITEGDDDYKHLLMPVRISG